MGVDTESNQFSRSRSPGFQAYAVGFALGIVLIPIAAIWIVLRRIQLAFSGLSPRRAKTIARSFHVNDIRRLLARAGDTGPRAPRASE